MATIGPASESEAVLAQLIEAGMDVARLNLSHGTDRDLRRRLDALTAVRERLGVPLGIMLDTRGPEVRIGDFPGGSVELRAGQPFVLTGRKGRAGEGRVWINYPRLAADVRPGQRVLLDDGNLVLRVDAVDEDDVRCVVEVGGTLLGGKKVNLPGVALDLPVLMPDDLRDLRIGAEYGCDFVAASFVNSAEDVLGVRRTLESIGADMEVNVKIETMQAVERFDQIVRACDSVMVARGDLGVELPVEDVPLIQKDLLRVSRENGKPSITATQMLESMIEHPRPTRAEATDVFNAIFDGSDAVMLSAESAIGAYPVEAVRVMGRIAERAEQALPYKELLGRQAASAHSAVTDAIAYATVATAENLGATSIVTSTESGQTARFVAKCRPRAPIIACTPHRGTRTRLTMVWGVVPILVPPVNSTDEVLATAVRAALDAGHIQNGDLVVETAGVSGTPGSTNLLKAETVAETVLRGQGIPGRERHGAAGHACLVRSAADAAARFRDGDVLVAPSTDAELVPYMRRAAAVITEDGGLTSHAAVVALSLGLPVVVGAPDAMTTLTDGQLITVDGQRGLVLRGRARVL